MITVYVMNTCPDCTYIEEQIKDNPNFKIIDIGEHVHNLKAFLSLRDNHEAFKKVRERGTVGIPAFVLENGDVTLRAEEVGLVSRKKGLSCNLDNREGC